MRHLVLILLACSLGLSAARAAPEAAPAPAGLTPAQAQAVLDVLQDAKKRTEFETVLNGIIHVAPAVTAHSPLVANSIGAELLVQGQNWAASMAAQFRASLTAVQGLPQLRAWLLATADDPAELAALGDALWKLAIVAAAALGAEWVITWLLAGFRQVLQARAPVADITDDPPIADEPASLTAAEARAKRGHLSVAWHLLRRLPFVLAVLLVDFVPTAAFALVANGLLALPLGITATDRLAVMAIVDAYVACQAALFLTRAIVAPDQPNMRLVRCSGDTARYTVRWVRRLSVVAVSGYAIAEVALMYGLARPAHDALLKLFALVVHGMLVAVVLQVRYPVEARLRPRRHATGVIAALQSHMAHRWHTIAIFYIIALWLVSAAEIRDGYVRLLHFFVVTTGTLLLARLAGIVLLGTLDRTMRADPDTVSQYPLIEQRLSQYYPLVRAVLISFIVFAAALVLLEGWGFRPLLWFSVGQLGARLVSAAVTSLVTVLVAVIVWEITNTTVETKIAMLARAAQTARAARLRTLLPMLRTALAITLVILAGLIVLSQIGVNIAPLLAGAGVLGVAIGFGSQKLVQDLITGLFLLLENAMQVGDVVTLASLTGTVEYLSIRTIRLRALDGSMHIIPFSSVTTVTNQTRDFAYALVDLPIGLDEEPDRVADLLSDVVRSMRQEPRWEGSITADLEVMGVYAFNDATWTMRVRIRTIPSQRWSVNREFNRRVKYCFDENAVQSPITSYKVQGWLPPGVRTADAKARGTAGGSGDARLSAGCCPMNDPVAARPTIAQLMLRDGFAFVHHAEMRGVLEAVGLADWDAFAASWHDLGLDTYMADGGRYRQRRHAVFTASPSGFSRLPPRPHYQSRDHNLLNGGIERWFQPVTAAVEAMQSFKAILSTCHRVFAALSPGVTDWEVEVHQFRIEAQPGLAGRPTPEGLHRDGVDWVLVLMVRRENVESGETTIYDHSHNLLGSFTLTRPMDAAWVDDRRVLHGVTPVTPLDDGKPALRDVLVVTFRDLSSPLPG